MSHNNNNEKGHRILDMGKKKKRIKRTPAQSSKLPIQTESPGTGLVVLEQDHDAPANENACEEALHVLVAEDAESVRRTLAAFLDQCGYTYDMTDNGSDAVDKAVEQPYDLILMDIQMPVMDGLRAARRIRAISIWNAATPILAVTGYTKPEERAKCFDAGMDGCVAKPIRPADLLAAIHSVLPKEREVMGTNLIAG